MRVHQASFPFSFFLSECAVIGVQWPSFLSSLSLSTYFHFWSGFILVPDIGANFPGYSNRDWLLDAFSFLGTPSKYKAFVLHLRESCIKYIVTLSPLLTYLSYVFVVLFICAHRHGFFPLYHQGTPN